MKVLIFSTEQFKPVADLTRPFIKGNVIYRGLPPQTDDGKFGTQTFNYISKLTAGYCVEEMEKMEDGDLLLYCDSDVLLLEDPQWFAEQIGDNDFIFQSDYGTPCMGFFVVRVSDRTKKVMLDAISLMDNTKNYQQVFNEIYDKYGLKYGYFKTSDVWNYGVNKGEVWNGGDITIPNNLKAFHANYTVGIENKIKLLKLAIKQYQND